MALKFQASCASPPSGWNPRSVPPHPSILLDIPCRMSALLSSSCRAQNQLTADFNVFPMLSELYLCTRPHVSPTPCEGQLLEVGALLPPCQPSLSSAAVLCTPGKLAFELKGGFSRLLPTAAQDCGPQDACLYIRLLTRVLGSCSRQDLALYLSSHRPRHLRLFLF